MTCIRTTVVIFAHLFLGKIVAREVRKVIKNLLQLLLMCAHKNTTFRTVFLFLYGHCEDRSEKVAELDVVSGPFLTFLRTNNS